MKELLKQAKETEELQPTASVNTHSGIQPSSLALLGILVLFAIEGAFLWHFYISPYNILLLLALIQLTVASFVCLFLPRFRKLKLCFAGSALLGASFLATSVAWDERIAAIRYGIQVEYFPESLGITKTTEQIGFPSGEGIGIEKGQVPGQQLYVFKVFDERVSISHKRPFG
jgi:hypothetical protein